MSIIDIKYTTPGPVASAFLRSYAPWQVLTGPFGSGKSVCCVMKILALCAAQKVDPKTGYRQSRWAIVRNTSQQLTDTTLATWRDWVIEGPMGYWKESERTWFLQFNDVRAEIKFRALDRPEDVRKLLSMELTGAWLNEAREIPYSMWGDIYGRTQRYPNFSRVGSNWYGLIADTNMPEEESALYESMESELTARTQYNDQIKTKTLQMDPTGAQPQDARDIIKRLQEDPRAEVESAGMMHVFKQPSGLSEHAENLDNLTPGYYQGQAALDQTKTRDKTRVNVHAQYGRSIVGKAVFEQTYDADVHESDTPLQWNPYKPLLAGMDFGRDPSIVFGQYGIDDRFYVLREFYKNNMSLETFIPLLNSFLVAEFPGLSKLNLIIAGDPSGAYGNQVSEATCKSVLQKAGFRVTMDLPNTLAPRLGAVEYFLTTRIPGMLLDPSVAFLRAGMRGKYRYPQKRNGTVGLTPEKNDWSHICDALEYLCLLAQGAGKSAQLMSEVDMSKIVGSRRYRGPADRVSGY